MDEACAATSGAMAAMIGADGKHGNALWQPNPMLISQISMRRGRL